MAKPAIVLCFPVKKDGIQRIAETAGDQWQVIESSQETIGNDIFKADIFCGHAKQKQVDWAKVVEQGKLKWIQSSAAGLDHCLAPSVIESEMIVSGCSALFARQVSEQTMALLFTLLRSMNVFHDAKKRKEFIRRPTDEIQGKTIGIVGFGGNGQQIARNLRTFGVKIIATDCFPDACQSLKPEVVDEVYAPQQLATLLTQSDIVILTLPLTQQNENSFGTEQFLAMKQGAYLINVGRGSVVDHAALVEFLKNDKLKGAGLDVCEPEPLPVDSPLWEMDNVVISPHVGAQSKTRIPVTVDLFCENLKRYKTGNELQNLVDKRLGFPKPEHRVEL